METSESSTPNEEKATGLWGQLPSFDPSTDDIREFSQKARFLHGVFPAKDKSNLAPRLAMQCKGTAWNQVRMLDPSKLIQADTGVEYLLEALSAWEETSELKTFELFEKALYKVVQRPDEASHSYALRLRTAFADLSEKVTIKEMQAFVLLRQSALNNEDKKRVLTMAGGSFDLKTVEQAMRTLSTKVLFSTGETKKKIYTTNFAEQEEGSSIHAEEDGGFHSTYHVNVEEEDILTTEHIEHLAHMGDEDALTVMQFEEMMQEIPDLQEALVTYQEARAKINDRKRSRGFWPNKGKGKSFFRGGRKGGTKSGKEELLAKISRTHCKVCGERGHWKAECPKREGAREQANVVQSEMDFDEPLDLPQVIFEQINEDCCSSVESCFSVHSLSAPPQVCIRSQVKQKALKFWSNRVHKYLNKGVKGNKDNGEQAKSKHRMSKMQPVRRPSDVSETGHDRFAAECFHSQVHRNSKQAAGLAILDTGASRSVIGNDHVPSVLGKLPASIRAQVRECPSKVGFRFGNNQIAYSFKQLQIPLMHQKQRIWLLIEVVPKATPFLLSIKTMKSLGAHIDLSQNTCYLQTLNRSLPLKENQNGLIVIDMADLCQPPEKESEAAFLVSSAHISKPPGLPEPTEFQDAHPSRGTGGTSSAVGGDPGVSQVPLCDAVQHDQSCATRRTIAGERDCSNLSADQRGESTEEQDHGAGEHHSEAVSESSSSIAGTFTNEPKSVGDHWHGPVGARRNERRSPKPWNQSWRSTINWSKPRYFPTYGICEHDANSGEAASSSGSQEQSVQDSWNPIGQPIATGFWSASHGKQRWTPSGPHTGRTGPVGNEAHHMGKEAQWKVFQRGLRVRPRVHTLGASKSWKPSRRFGGLSELHDHSTKASSNGSTKSGSVSEWHSIPKNRFQSVYQPLEDVSVTNTEEAKWLKEVFWMVQKGHNKCSKLDLLEVYAYPQSNLTEVAQQCGLKAERFTIEDGDLSTSDESRPLHSQCSMNLINVFVTDNINIHKLPEPAPGRANPSRYPNLPPCIQECLQKQLSKGFSKKKQSQLKYQRIMFPR